MAERNEDLRALIELYVLGELDEEKVTEVENRLRDDAEARAELEELRNIMAAVGGVEMEVPSRALSDSVTRRVHFLMARRHERRREHLWRSVASLFSRPAAAAAAAVIVAGVCLGLVLALRTLTEREDEPPIVVDEGERVTPIGKAAAAAYGFAPYVEQTKEIFEEILRSDAAGIREILKGRRLDTFVARAWSLREIEEGPRAELLLDIEGVWRMLSKFAADADETVAEKAKEDIIEKRIIQRMSEALSVE